MPPFIATNRCKAFKSQQFGRLRGHFITIGREITNTEPQIASRGALRRRGTRLFIRGIKPSRKVCRASEAGCPIVRMIARGDPGVLGAELIYFGRCSMALRNDLIARAGRSSTICFGPLSHEKRRAPRATSAWRISWNHGVLGTAAQAPDDLSPPLRPTELPSAAAPESPVGTRLPVWHERWRLRLILGSPEYAGRQPAEMPWTPQ